MSNDYSVSGEAFQKKLLAMLVLDPETFLPVIDPSYFANPMLGKIAKIVHGAYGKQDLQKTRLTRSTLWTLMWRDLQGRNREVRSEVKGSYRKTKELGVQIVQV